MDPLTPASPFDVEVTKDERTMALLAHLLPIMSGFIGPLIIYAVKANESKFVAYHAMQASIFVGAWTVLIITLYLCTCGFGIFLVLPLLPVVIIAQVYMAMKANEGEWRGYPGMAHFGLPEE